MIRHLAAGALLLASTALPHQGALAHPAAPHHAASSAPGFEVHLEADGGHTYIVAVATSPEVAHITFTLLTSDGGYDTRTCNGTAFHYRHEIAAGGCPASLEVEILHAPFWGRWHDLLQATVPVC